MRRKFAGAALAAALTAACLGGCTSDTDKKTTTEAQKTTEVSTAAETTAVSETTTEEAVTEEVTTAKEAATEAVTTEETAAETTKEPETAGQEADETTASESGSDGAADIGNGELVIFTWEGMFPDSILDGFEETYGIEIVYSNFDTDETMLQKLSTAKGGDYDLVIADDYIIENVIAEGLAQKLDQKSLTNWENINPVYQGQFYDPDDEYTVPLGAGIPLIVYDPDVVECEITGYNSLWDPSLEDSVALIGNYRVIMGITQLAMGESMNTEDVAVIESAGEKSWLPMVV